MPQLSQAQHLQIRTISNFSGLYLLNFSSSFFDMKYQLVSKTTFSCQLLLYRIYCFLTFILLNKKTPWKSVISFIQVFFQPGDYTKYFQFQIFISDKTSSTKFGHTSISYILLESTWAIMQQLFHPIIHILYVYLSISPYIYFLKCLSLTLGRKLLK